MSLYNTSGNTLCSK